MRFWSGSAFVEAAMSALVMLALVAVAGVVLRRIRVESLVPRALAAGVLGLGLGPTGLDVLPVTRLGLETLVYHGLGLVFAAVALRTPAPKSTTSHDARIIAAALLGLAALQALVGVLFVAVLFAVGRPVHIGFGLLLPLGFNQGPGQALSMGEAWEPMGLSDGGGIGLIIAALGFGWCFFGGMALLFGGRRGFRGLRRDAGTETPPAPGVPARRMVGALVPLAIVYVLTGFVLAGLGALLQGRDNTVAMVYAFHFMIALTLGVVARPTARRLRRCDDDTALAVASGSMVDVTTTAAIAAISAGVLTRWLGPILAMTVVGGLTTLLICVRLRRRFRHFGLEHAVLVYGIATGTFLTGMAVLRAVDPNYESPAARNAVVAAGAEVLLAAPLLLFVMPYAVGPSPARRCSRSRPPPRSSSPTWWRSCWSRVG